MKCFWFLFPVLIIFFLSCDTTDSLEGVPAEYADLPGTLISKDTAWAGDLRLKGQYYVMPGITLTILKGTTVSWEYHNNNIEDVGALITLPADRITFENGPRPSGRLIANGTADEPIVFTSSRTVKLAGDWGGIILAGEAPNNIEGGIGRVEGLPQSMRYGGNNSMDDSGSLRYVRIEYVGFGLEQGSEINGLSLYSVGSETTLEYIQVFKSTDDGFEWFGGTVNSKYLVSMHSDDDSFDMDLGWNGKNQFWLGVQANGADKGFEANGGCADQDNCTGGNGPTAPSIYNVTMYGSGTDNGEDIFGLYLRDGTEGEYKNIIIANYGKATGLPIVVNEDGTVDNIGGSLTFGGNISFNNENEDYSGYTYDENDLGLDLSTDPQFVDPTNFKFALQTGSPALSGAVSPPSDDFFDQVSYRGAFDTNDWTASGTWVRWE